MYGPASNHGIKTTDRNLQIQRPVSRFTSADITPGVDGSTVGNQIDSDVVIVPTHLENITSGNEMEFTGTGASVNKIDFDITGSGLQSYQIIKEGLDAFDNDGAVGSDVDFTSNNFNSLQRNAVDVRKENIPLLCCCQNQGIHGGIDFNATGSTYVKKVRRDVAHIA